MAGPEPITPLNVGTSSQNAKSLIEGHISALKELLKEPNNRNLIKPMLLDFDDVQDVSDEEIEGGMKGKAKIGDEDLSKPFKEVLKCPFTRRIIEFSSSGHRLPANARIYDGTGDPEDHVGRFVGMGNQGEWPMPVWCKMFQPTLDGKARAWFDKLPPELAKRFSDNIPKTVDEILKSVDDYLRSEEAFCSTELPRGNLNEGIHQCNGQNETTETSGSTMGITAVGKSTSLLPECRNEILATEHQLHLPQPAPLMGVPKAARNSPRIRKTESSNKGRKAKGKRGAAEQWPAEGEARYLSEEALVVEAEVEGYLVRRIHIDEGASVEIMFEHCFNMLHPSIRSKLVETHTIVFGFSGEQVKPLGNIKLDVCFRGGWRCRRAIMKCTVIPAPSPYNIIMGRPGLKQLWAIPSTIHGMIKFPTPWGWQQYYRKRRWCLSVEGSSQLKSLLKRNTDIFAWEPSDMTGVPKRYIKHSMNVNPLERPVTQKRRVFFPEKSQVITKEVDEWLRAGIVRPVQMAEEYEEKTDFYIDRGTYCYTKMSFDLKNVGATYQRLVDRAFKTQIERKLEAYIDDMVIKSKSEREMLVDIAETFDNLRRINMKLNLKKCSFGVAEGKFLGYMVTSEGIRANSEKTKDIAEM
nr:hypothetical protein [Tanacetum cinerariifolium]